MNSNKNDSENLVTFREACEIHYRLNVLLVEKLRTLNLLRGDKSLLPGLPGRKGFSDVQAVLSEIRLVEKGIIEADEELEQLKTAIKGPNADYLLDLQKKYLGK